MDEEAIAQVLRPFLDMTGVDGHDGGGLRAAAAPGRVVLVKDSLSLSGLFLIHLILKLCVQLGHRVVLVVVEQSLDKYKAVMRKMSVQLQPLLDSGQLQVLQPQQPSAAPASATAQSALQALALQLNQAAMSSAAASGGQAASGSSDAAGRAPTSVIIDSLTDLHCLSTSEQEWATFIRYCLGVAIGLGSSAQQPQAPAGVCVLRMHGDVDGGSVHMALVEHAAEVLLDVQPLEGQVADIHGQVKLVARNTIHQRRALVAAAGQSSLPPTIAGSLLVEPLRARQALLFRATELGVKWIPHVTSQHLLWR